MHSNALQEKKMYAWETKSSKEMHLHSSREDNGVYKVVDCCNRHIRRVL